MSRRDSNGRLDMSAVREQHAPRDLLQQSNKAVEKNALEYTAQWVDSVELSERARSVDPCTHTAGVVNQPRPSHSVPARSVRPKVSSASHTRRTRLELELKHLREEQQLWKRGNLS